MMSTQSQPKRGVITGVSRLQNTDTSSVKSTPNNSAPSTPRPAPTEEDWDSLLNISPRRRISPLSYRLGARSRPASTKNDSPPNRTPRISSLNLDASHQTSSRNSSAPRTPTISEPARPTALPLREQPKPPVPERISAAPVVPSFLTGWDGADGWGDDPSLDDSDPEADEGTWGEWGDVGDITIPEEKNDLISAETPTAPVNIQSSERLEDHHDNTRATTAEHEKESEPESPIEAPSPMQEREHFVRLENNKHSRDIDLAVDSIGESEVEVVERAHDDAIQSEQPPCPKSTPLSKSTIATREETDDASIDDNRWGAWDGFDGSQPHAEQNMSSFSMLPEDSDISKPPGQPHSSTSGHAEESQHRSESERRERAPANDPERYDASEAQVDPPTDTQNELETSHIVSERREEDRQSSEIGILSGSPKSDFQNAVLVAPKTFAEVSVPEDRAFITPQAESPGHPTPKSNSTGHFNATDEVPAESAEQHSYTLLSVESLQDQFRETGTSSDSRAGLKECDNAPTNKQGSCERDEVLDTVEKTVEQSEKREEDEAWECWNDRNEETVTVVKIPNTCEENKAEVQPPLISEKDMSAQQDIPALSEQIDHEKELGARREAEKDEVRASDPQLSTQQDMAAHEMAEKQHENANSDSIGEYSTREQLVDFGVPDDVPRIEDNSWGGWGDVDNFAIPSEQDTSQNVEERERPGTVSLQLSEADLGRSSKDVGHIESEAQETHHSRVPPPLQTHLFDSVGEVHNDILSLTKEQVREDYTHHEPSTQYRDARTQTNSAETPLNEAPSEHRKDVGTVFFVARDEADLLRCSDEGSEQNTFQEELSASVRDVVDSKCAASMPTERKVERDLCGEQSSTEEESKHSKPQLQTFKLSEVDATQSAKHRDTLNDRIMDSFTVNYQPQNNQEEWGGWDDIEFATLPDSESAPSHADMVRKDENVETSDLEATIHTDIDSVSSGAKKLGPSTQFRQHELGHQTGEELSTHVVTTLGRRNTHDVQKEQDKITVPENEVLSMPVPPQDVLMQSFAETNSVPPDSGSWGGWDDSSEIADMSQPKSSKVAEDVLQPDAKESMSPLVFNEPHGTSSLQRTPFESNERLYGGMVSQKTATASQNEEANHDFTVNPETVVPPKVQNEDEDTHVSTQASYASSYWTQKLNDGSISKVNHSSNVPAVPPIPISQSTDHNDGTLAFTQQSEDANVSVYDPFAPTGNVVQTEQPFMDGFDLETLQTKEQRPSALWAQTEVKDNTENPMSQRISTTSGEPFGDYSFDEQGESKPRMDDELASAFTQTTYPHLANESTPSGKSGKAVRNEGRDSLTFAEMESFDPVEDASDKQAAESEASSYLPSLDYANLEARNTGERSIVTSKVVGGGVHDSYMYPYPGMDSRVGKEQIPTRSDNAEANDWTSPSAEAISSSQRNEMDDTTSMMKNQGHPRVMENDVKSYAPHQERLELTNPNSSNSRPELSTCLKATEEPLETQAAVGIDGSPREDNGETNLDSFLAPPTEPGEEKNSYAPNRMVSSTETSSWGERKESQAPHYPVPDVDSHEEDHRVHTPQSSHGSVPQVNDQGGAYDMDLQAYAPKQGHLTANTAYNHPSLEVSGSEEHSYSESATGSIENPISTPYSYALAKNQDRVMPGEEYAYQTYQNSAYNIQETTPVQKGHSNYVGIERTQGTDSSNLTAAVNPYAPNSLRLHEHSMENVDNVSMDPSFGGNGSVPVPQPSLPQPGLGSYIPSGFSAFEAPHHRSAGTVSDVQSFQEGASREGNNEADNSASATPIAKIPEVNPEHYRLEPHGTTPNIEAVPSHPRIPATETYPQYTPEIPGYGYGDYYANAPEAPVEMPAETQQDSAYLDGTFFSYPFSIMDTSPSGDMIHPGPRPIVTWGFAGSMVTVFPRKQDQAQHMSSNGAQNSGHTVQIFDIGPLGKDGADDDWIAASEAVRPLSFPLKSSNLEPYAKMCDNLSKLSAGLDGPAAEARAALWRTLALLCRTDGDDWRKEAGHAVCGPTSVPLFDRNDLRSAPAKEQMNFVKPSHHGQSDDETAASFEVERLLTVGKGVEAVDSARKSGMWSLALILSGMIDTKLYTSVLCDYARHNLQEGSALQTLCFSLAENDAEIIRRITSSAGLEEWRKNVGMLLTSGASVTTSKATETRFLHLIEKVGDALITQHADVVGAHVCYLLSGRLGPLDSKGICLLGANPSTPPGRPRSLGSAASILQSVVYEAAMNARGGASFPHILPFRLLLAREIASVGHPDIALAHCDSVSKQVRVIFDRNNSIASQFTAPFLSSLESFDQRLRGHLGLREEVGNLTKLTALGKSLSSVFSRASKERHSTPRTSADESLDQLPNAKALASTPGAPYQQQNTGVAVSMPFNHPPHLSVDSQWGAGYNSLRTAGFINQNSAASTQATKVEKSGKEKWDQFVSKTVGLIAPADYDLSPPPPSRVPPSMAQHPAPIGLDGGSGSRTSTQGLAPNHMRSSSVGAIPSAFFNNTPALTSSRNGELPHAESRESKGEKGVPSAVLGKSEHAVLNGVPLQKVTREENNDAIVHRRSASDMTQQSQTSEKKPPLHPKKPAGSSNVTDTSANTEKRTQKKGWRERLREKLTATFGGPPRAHMGEENKFVFDKKRGRWVIEGEEPTEDEDVPPPPPDDDDMFGVGASTVPASSSYDPLPSTEQSTHNVSTLLRSQSAQDALGSNGFNYSYNEHIQAPATLQPPSSGPGSLDNSIGGDDGSAASVASAASAPVPYSAASSSKTLPSGSTNRDSNKYRRVGRPSGRRAYVDTFNKGKPSMSTSALPTPARPAVPAYGAMTAATGSGYNIFTPTPIPSTSTGNSNVVQGASSSTSVVETSDQLTTSLSDTSSSHNMLASNQSGGHVTSLKPPAHPSGGFSPGRQPRMMA